MMNKILIDEATVKLALDALENSVDLVEEDYANAVSLYGKYPSRAQRLIGMETMRDDHIKAITVLKALAEQPAQQEPFGYFKAEPFGWTDCAETDEGAVALYTTPQPAQQTACTWAQTDSDHMPGTWQADCGAMWTFTESGPKDNDMHFCPKCGKPAIEAALNIKE